MKIIVGLGNPGAKYRGTPHNAGFDVIDELARRWEFRLTPKTAWQAEAAEGRVGGHLVMLVKPLTYMNRSGDAVASAARQREVGPDDLLVVSDDVNLPVGRLRLRDGGSHGGHNGLRSVIERLGRDDFARLRIGICPNRPMNDLVEFVLSRLPREERDQIAEMVLATADAIENWLDEGTAATANKINGLRRFAAGAGDE